MSTTNIAQLPSHVVAEESGLVTLFVDPAVVPQQLARLPRALRVRLNPPGDELREGSHVHDLAGC